MNSELLAMLEYLEQEREIDKATLFALVEEALTGAAIKELGESVENPTVEIDRKNGDIITWADFIVVDEVGDRRKEIILDAAKEYESSASLGDTVRCKYETTKNLTRIAAQSTKQSIMQKLRMLEKERVQEEYSEHMHDLLSGTVRYFERGEVVIDFGTAEGALGQGDRIPSEDYHNGDHITVYLKDVNVRRAGPSLICSRTHPDLVRKLFEREVNEIAEGIVEIKAIAREAGYRTKIAVVSSEDRIDPVGACVGLRGARVKAIVRELNREKLDIVHWTPDTRQLITEALKPAEVMKVDLDFDSKTAKVTVSDEQYSLAVGKRGHNAKLARQLTGWNIDIARFQFKEEQTFEQRLEEVKSMFLKIPCVTEEIADNLVSNGYLSLDGVSASELSDLTGIEGIDEEIAAEILQYVTEKKLS
ncbi:MAG: transcription termination factor NusA [Lentisphaeraceae bacterium]|nr:transcription termination factor NusA [Lentisphaeraceae bacterium]